MDADTLARVQAIEMRNQIALIESVRIELDLGLTMLQTVCIEADLDPDAIPGPWLEKFVMACVGFV